MRLFRLLRKGLAAALILTTVALVTGVITMWLAAEKDKVQLPRVIGMDSTAALELLRKQGLQPKVSGREYSETIQQDAIIFQRPASGSWVQKNSKVRLVVSQGSDAVVLPNLTGLPLPEVQQLLQRYGFTLGRVVRVHSSERPNGEVIAQDPEAGALVRRGSPVAILLSLGSLEEPAPVLMPPTLSSLKSPGFTNRIRAIVKTEVIARKGRETLITRASYRDPTEKSGAPTEKRPVALRGAASVLVGAGDIASCVSDGDDATANLLDAIDGVVFTLGDNAYVAGTPVEFAACYDPSWGRHKSRTRPAPGNHDYHTRGAFGYFDYFGDAAGDPDKGYYSYDLGSWHIIVLNSNCAKIGGCGPGSPQEQWLRADLVAHPATCTLAYWHHPRFSSGRHGGDAALEAFWQALYEHDADVVLAGHDHVYERFAPQTPDGKPDPIHGIRQFVVGTGGDRHHTFAGPVIANSEVRNGETFGVLKLTLQPASYEWQFIPVAGQKFTDSGTGRCH
ncbi:MAG: PASTA domain-containing protein [bacterium]|uniref:PASTA domain-containing protein n=1 Tax=Candidatus Methylomirabilis tolerans TaxID=3123416 RepID=A0AAJ1AHD9_9BACT|nr:PASTA domain-containing protein [Candidatus Methylomirabilis sp.]